MGEQLDNAKTVLRTEMTARRAKLSRAEVLRRSASVCEHVLRLPAVVAARHFVLYAPIGNEVDPGRIVSAVAALAKCPYLPAADAPAFIGADGSELPVGDDCDLVVIVPGVAFDHRGVRLGRGGGWYDRALARHAAALRVGVAFEFQVVPRLPEAAWDQRMHVVVTEAGPLPCGTASGQPKETRT